uniref:Uncharacterized protein n=1 Tax=Knipowitschia caucasica TaxID=637954 RepID=A0AAV2L3U8_KNICA
MSHEIHFLFSSTYFLSEFGTQWSPYPIGHGTAQAHGGHKAQSIAFGIRDEADPRPLSAQTLAALCAAAARDCVEPCGGCGSGKAQAEGHTGNRQEAQWKMGFQDTSTDISAAAVAEITGGGMRPRLTLQEHALWPSQTEPRSRWTRDLTVSISAHVVK